MALNPDSPLPLYHQLAEILMGRIRAGDYAVDEKIPAEMQLARDFGIGRPTVRQAIDLLVRKGMVQRKRGSGTFVREVPAEVNLFSLAGTTSAFLEQGIAVKTDLLQKVASVAVGREEENPFAGTDAYLVSRLILAKGEPVLIEESYMDPGLFAGIDQLDLHGKSLAQVVADRFYMEPTGGKQVFRVESLNPERSSLLGLKPGASVLVIRRFLHFPQMQNGIYSEIFCRTDRFVFSQVIGERYHD